MDHAGLPLKTVLEQLDLLGEEVVPVLRKEFAALRPAHVPDGPIRPRGAHRRPPRRQHCRRHHGVGMSRRVVVVTAGLSTPSSTRLLSDRLADAVTRGAWRPGARRSRSRWSSCARSPHAIADNLLTGFPSGALADAVEAVRRADALVAVTPVFSASYSGLFKTFFDVLELGTLEGTPVLLARHRRHRPALAGPRPRAAAALRLPAGRGRADRGLRGHRGLREHCGRRPVGPIDRAAGELAALVAARPARPASGADAGPAVEEELADLVPFEEMLRRA